VPLPEASALCSEQTPRSALLILESYRNLLAVRRGEVWSWELLQFHEPMRVRSPVITFQGAVEPASNLKDVFNAESQLRSSGCLTSLLNRSHSPVLVLQDPTFGHIPIIRLLWWCNHLTPGQDGKVLIPKVSLFETLLTAVPRKAL